MYKKKDINNEILIILKKYFIQSYKSNPIITSFGSACISTVGLYLNSKVLLIGAMLMSPIIKLINNSNIYNLLQSHNVKLNVDYDSNWLYQLLIIVIMSIVSSYFLGKFMQFIDKYFNNYNRELPTPSMINRAEYKNIIYNIFFSSLLTIVLPIALITNNVICMVGISIVIALIPLLSNIGLSLSINKDTEISKDLKNTKLTKYKRNAVIVGMIIFIINLVIIYLPSKYLLNSTVYNKNIYKFIKKLYKFN